MRNGRFLIRFDGYERLLKTSDTVHVDVSGSYLGRVSECPDWGILYFSRFFRRMKVLLAVSVIETEPFGHWICTLERNLSGQEMHCSLRALVFVFICTWNLEGKGEDKGKLYVQHGQESLCSLYLHRLCKWCTFQFMLCIHSFRCYYFSWRCFSCSSLVLTAGKNEMMGHFLFSRTVSYANRISLRHLTIIRQFMKPSDGFLCQRRSEIKNDKIVRKWSSATWRRTKCKLLKVLFVKYIPQDMVTVQHNLIAVLRISHCYKPEKDLYWKWLSSGMLRRVVTYKLIALMIEAVSTSETSVSFYQNTRRNIPERQPSSYSPPWELEIRLFYRSCKWQYWFFWCYIWNCSLCEVYMIYLHDVSGVGSTPSWLSLYWHIYYYF
jgi:hypothetical protein